MRQSKKDEFVSKNSMLRKLESCQPDQFFNITQIRNFIKAEPEADVVTREEMEQEFSERIRDMLRDVLRDVLQDDEEDL